MKNHLEVIGLLPQQDAFGNNIFDCYHSGNHLLGYEIEERDDGRFILYGDSNAYFEPYKEWTSIQRVFSSKISGNILDIGCGAGKHSLYFQNKGNNVYAMDNSPLAIEICKKLGIRNTLLCDVENFHRSNLEMKFDSILFWGNNLGLLQNRSFFIYFFKLLENFSHKNTEIFLESMSPYGNGFQDEDTISYVRNNKSRHRLGGQMHVRVRYKKFVTPWTDYLFVSIKELKELLSLTNWKIKDIVEDEISHQYISSVIRK